MSVSIKQLRDNQNNFIYPKIAKEGLVEPINSNDVGISAINGIQSSTVQGALNELAGKNVEIVKTASGSVISVSDSADYRLLGLKLYGKSVQDGTPTPEAPVEIESAGDGGNVTARITGTNLLDFSGAVLNPSGTYHGVTVALTGDGGYTITGTLTTEPAINVWFLGNYSGTQNVMTLYPGTYTCKNVLLFYDGPYSFVQGSTITPNVPYTFNVQSKTVITGVRCVSGVVGTTYNETLYPILVRGSSLPEWEPYTGKTLTYPTPNGLPGIPVESGGNYTDAEGQQWICDEVDFGRGKYVQRIAKITLTGDMSWNTNLQWNEAAPDVFHYFVNITNKKTDTADGSNNLFCSLFEGKTNNGSSLTNTECVYCSYTNQALYVFLAKSRASTPDLEGFKGWIDQNQPVIYYILQNPIETDLTPEQLTAYAALTMYKPNTTVTTDSSPAAGIEVKYLTDSGVSEVLDYYASKADLDGKQDKLSGTAGQFVGFDAEGEAEAQEITAEDVGAMPTVDGGTTGQYLRKTADGQAWQDGPDLSGYATTADVAETYAKKALKFTGTFTAAGWTSATGGYSQMINVSGLTADDEPIIDLNSTATDADTFDGQLEAFGLVSNFTTGAGTLTAVVLGDSAPTVDIPIHGVVVY